MLQLSVCPLLNSQRERWRLLRFGHNNGLSLPAACKPSLVTFQRALIAPAGGQNWASICPKIQCCCRGHQKWYTSHLQAPLQPTKSYNFLAQLPGDGG